MKTLQEFNKRNASNSLSGGIIALIVIILLIAIATIITLVLLRKKIFKKTVESGESTIINLKA